MSTDNPSSVSIQAEALPIASVPAWFGEVALLAHTLTRLGLLAEISERVRFARKRFGTFEVIDFVVMLIGYAVSGEPTLKAYYERLQPFAPAFMGLFGRNQLPHRATALVASLPRWTSPLWKHCAPCSSKTRLLVSDQGETWEGCGIGRQPDGVSSISMAPDRQPDNVLCLRGLICRQRSGVCLRCVRPATPDASVGRLSVLVPRFCKPIPISGSSPAVGAGNGDYRGELLRGLSVIGAYQTALGLQPGQALLRLDGLYGNGAIVVDLIAARVCFVMRGKDYALLDLTQVKERLALPADEQFTHPESGTCRDVFDCGEVPLTAQGHRARLIVATHQAANSPIGVTRDGVVYELFFTALPALGFTAADVVKLYLHRGSFETVLADEDREQDSDRWSSYTPHGQEVWQILSQWIWNLRQELSQQWQPTSMRLTEFSPPSH